MSGEIDRTPNPRYPKMIVRNECVALVTKNEPKNQKYNLILAPVDEPVEKNPEPESSISKEEFDELVDRIVKQIGIPSDDAMTLFWKWWTEDVQRYIDELKTNGGRHEGSSSETDKSRENTSVG